MEDILVDYGYTIDWVEVWDVDDLEHVSIGFDTNNSIKVAYQGEKPEPGEYQFVRFKWGVEEVFKKFYKERIKSLLF